MTGPLFGSLAVLFALLGFVALSSRHASRRRESGIEAEAQGLGWRISPDRTELAGRLIRALPMGIPADDVRISNLVRFTVSGLDVHVFDCQVVLGANYRTRKDPRSSRQTVVWIRTPGLNVPTFAIQANNFHDLAWGKAFGVIAQARRALLPGYSPMEFESHPGFSKKFALLTPNPTEAGRFFTDTVLEKLSQLPPFQFQGGVLDAFLLGGTSAPRQRFLPDIEGKKDDILVYLSKVRIPAVQLPAFATWALELAETFRSRPALPGAPVCFEDPRWITECPQCHQRFDVSSVLGHPGYDFDPEPGQQMNCAACGTLFSLGERSVRFSCKACGGALQSPEDRVGHADACPACGAENLVPGFPSGNSLRLSRSPARSGGSPEPAVEAPRYTVGEPVAARTSRAGAWAAIVFSVVWLSAVVFIGNQLAGTLLRQISAQSWPSVQGEVISTRIEPVRASSKGGSHLSYSPRIAYRYPVEGRSYQGTLVGYIQPSYPREEEARAFLENQDLSPGSPVPVYYNPRQPAEAVLLRSVDGIAWIPLLFIAPFGGVGLFMLWRGIRGLSSGR